ncbi:Phage tail protein E [Bordetella ansorpii]|uniref:Phage tail protein E n=1 Tax=Bordetella ansorpii TaxID=288768 RepID=A0A157QNS0_9BORD|nr:phage tail assembly protein [Bordetella ansorpii]SAI47515.1 Phage tail protein E [Bordetella ansorpii]
MSTPTETTAAIPANNPNLRTVTLDEPIQRNGQDIATLTIRKPNTGALRGVTLVALAQIDVAALQIVLPRICDPILTPAEIAALDPADLMSVGAEVASFFIPKAQRASFQTT